MALSAIVTLGLAVGLFTSTMNAGNGGPGVPTLTEVEVADLLFIREEEKLARDVYLFLYDDFGKKIFVTIAASEQSHMDAVLVLLNKYGLEDPAYGKDPGEFENTILQGLYDDLIKACCNREALEAGVFIEETDIEDLGIAISDTDKEDIKKVYGRLLEGSLRHLDAFNSHLD